MSSDETTDLHPSIICERLANADISDHRKIVNCLRRLNNNFRTDHGPVIFDAFNMFHICERLVALARNWSMEGPNAALMCLVTFTQFNVDLVQIFVEHGLLILVIEGISSSDRELVCDCLAIMNNVFQMSSVYRRRIERVMNVATVGNLVEANDKRILRQCGKFMARVFEFCRSQSYIESHISTFLQLLAFDDMDVIEKCLYGFSCYVESSRFVWTPFANAGITDSFRRLGSIAHAPVHVWLGKITGSLFEKRINSGLDVACLARMVRSDNQEVRSLSYWCLETGFIAEILNQKDVIAFVMELCRGNELSDAFNARCKLVDLVAGVIGSGRVSYEQIREFMEVNVVGVLLGNVCVDESVLICRSVHALSLVIDMTNSKGDLNMFMDSFYANNGEEAVMELSDSTDPDVVRFITQLQMKIRKVKKADACPRMK